MSPTFATTGSSTLSEHPAKVPSNITNTIAAAKTLTTSLLLTDMKTISFVDKIVGAIPHIIP